MIEYQLTSWLKSTFSYHGTALPRILLRVLSLPIITFFLLYFHHDWVNSLNLSTIGHSLIGTALGLVLVFRNNASYDRYWEGRKKWGGIVNASRNLARAAISYGGDLKTLAPIICSFCHALKHQLRGESPRESISSYATEEQLEHWLSHPVPSLMINLEMSDWLNREVERENIPIEQAQRMEVQIAVLMDHQGACERILKTPVPFAHVVHVRQLLFFYLLTLPFVLIPILNWAAILVVTVIGLGLLGIEEAGVEIEDPFGHDPNDLPLNKICQTICRDVNELIRLNE